MYLYLGIDPGTHKLGWACLTEEGTRLASGVLKPSDDKAQTIERTFSLAAQLKAVILELSEQGQVRAATIEKPFLRPGVHDSAFTLTGGYWAAIFVMWDHGIDIKTLMPSQLKKVAGKGNFSKQEMIQTAAMRFDLSGIVPDHVADALWAAHHAWSTCDERLVPER